MAWSDHKFSAQYAAARDKLKNGAVADGFKIRRRRCCATRSAS